MKNKIELYKELFASDPTSKIFFPLARLYFEAGLLQEAAGTLKKGLDRHPDHMEARLFLVDILHEQEKDEEIHSQTEVLHKTLSRYSFFWEAWAAHAATESKDLAIALKFMAASMAGRPLCWADIIEQGIQTSLLHPENAQKATPPPSAPRPLPIRKKDAGPSRLIERTAGDDANLRTRTMAELLVAQGDTKGALEIYEELINGAEEDSTRRELQILVDTLKSGVRNLSQQEDTALEASQKESSSVEKTTDKLANALSVLADRLEARAESSGQA